MSQQRSRVLMGAVLTTTLCVMPGGRAGGQDLPLLGLFKNPHSVTLHAQFADLSNSPQLSTRSSQCIVVSVCGAGTEALFDLTEAAGSAIHLELGLGASYLRGFSARSNALDLRGSIRSFPTFSGYVTTSGPLAKFFSPYVGLTFGLSDLWNAQVYGADSIEVGLKGQTFDYGAIVGVALVTHHAGNLFVEAAIKARRFASLDYDKREAIPSGWPRELDLSGWQVSLGWQFDLRPEEKGPPPFPRTWVLAKVDGLALPGVLEQTRHPGGSTLRELVTGTLELRADNRYVLTLRERIAGLDDGGRVVSRTPTESVEMGTYRIQDEALSLRPQGSGPEFSVRRQDDEIVVSHARRAHWLSFRKVGR